MIQKRTLWETFVFLFCLLCGMLVGLQFMGCASTPAPGHATATREQLASVVVLVEQVADWQEPAISSDAFGEHTGSYSAVWRGRCNAFAMARDGELYLVTAAHCLRERALGSVVRYLPPDGWGVDRAVVSKLESVRDYAELRPERSGGLEALPRGPVPAVGASVLSVSAFFEEQAPGRAQGALSGSWYGTSQRIAHGWSGSPVLDAQGRAWGFLARCVTYAGKCVDGAIVGAL